MTDKQTEALRPASGVVMREGLPTLLMDKDIKSTDERLYAASEIQRLQHKVADLTQALEIAQPVYKERDRLEALNKELLEALHALVAAHGSILDLRESGELKLAREAITKATYGEAA